MATVTVPSDVTVLMVQIEPKLVLMKSPRPVVFASSPPGSDALGGPTTGQLFPVGNR